MPSRWPPSKQKKNFFWFFEGGREEDFKNQRPSRSCHRAAGPRCPLGSCRSYSCPLQMWPGGKTQESFTGGMNGEDSEDDIKDIWNIWRVLTLGIIGGVNVPFFRPSQLKPSNHLKGRQHYFVISYSSLPHSCITHHNYLLIDMLTCAFGCLWHHFSSFPVVQKDYPCGRQKINESAFEQL